MSVSYRDGKKYHGNQVFDCVSAIHRRSSSSPAIYTAMRYSDGTGSCNCPGFANNHAKGKVCKHVKELLSLPIGTFDPMPGMPAAETVPTGPPPKATAKRRGFE